ncbi:MAG: VWA domain-containing protein [Deltaproteobacteria bacterium]|nr:VWA domain-containing protein [Deltaproteobacteria bacterium]
MKWMIPLLTLAALPVFTACAPTPPEAPPLPPGDDGTGADPLRPLSPPAGVGLISTVAASRAPIPPPPARPGPSTPMVRRDCGARPTPPHKAVGLRGGGGAEVSGAAGTKGSGAGTATPKRKDITAPPRARYRGEAEDAVPAQVNEAEALPNDGGAGKAGRADQASPIAPGAVGGDAAAPAGPPPAPTTADAAKPAAAAKPLADAAPAAPAEPDAGATPPPAAAPVAAEAPVEEAKAGGEGYATRRPRSNKKAEAAPPPPPTPRLDWGATVFLSNDDSMSLASAQRLLWAVERGAPFTTGQVRPHELLNYFTFDTAASTGGAFSVLGAAEQQGDTLSVALAVRGASPPRPPLDLSLVVDRSGSMAADGRMEYVQRGLLLAIDQLVAGDRVDLVLFDSEVCAPVESFVVGRDDLELLKAEVRAVRPRSATDLNGGLSAAYGIQSARADAAGRARRVLLLTDAFLNEGSVNPDLLAAAARHYDEHGLRVTAVGVGREFNDAVLDKLTERSRGSYVYLGSELVVDRVFGAGFASLVHTVAEDVQFALELPPDLAMQRFYGEESSTVAAEVQPIHFAAGTTQLFLQDLKLRGAGRDQQLQLVARYTNPATGARETERFAAPVSALLAADPHNLHKAQALMRWSDLLLAWSLGDRSCAQSSAVYAATDRAAGDAELAYVAQLTGKLCGEQPPVGAPGAGLVAYTVRLNSDVPIAEVALRCGADQWRSRLSGSDTVARFAAIRPGACQLVLEGQVPMTAAVQVPETGGQSTCVLRGGRVSCG